MSRRESVFITLVCTAFPFYRFYCLPVLGPGCCINPLFFGTCCGRGVKKWSLRSFIAGLYTGLYLVSFGGLSWSPYKCWPGNPTVIILGFGLRRGGAPNYPFMLRHTRLPPSVPWSLQPCEGSQVIKVFFPSPHPYLPFFLSFQLVSYPST